MKTLFLLLAQYEKAVIPVEVAARDYLALDPAQAKRKAAHNDLPFPVFREGQKGVWLVRLIDVAAWIDNSASAARERMAA